MSLGTLSGCGGVPTLTLALMEISYLSKPLAQHSVGLVKQISSDTH